MSALFSPGRPAAGRAPDRRRSLSGQGRWLLRILLAALAFTALEVLFHVLGDRPDHLRLALIVALAAAASSLLLDSLPVEAALWRVRADRPVTPSGQDPRTASYVRLLENHRTAREPDGSLQDRLGELAEQVLLVRHDLLRGDPAAEALLGPDVTRVVDGAPRRLRVAEITACIDRLEEL